MSVAPAGHLDAGHGDPGSTVSPGRTPEQLLGAPNEDAPALMAAEQPRAGVLVTPDGRRFRVVADARGTVLSATPLAAPQPDLVAPLRPATPPVVVTDPVTGAPA